MPIQSVIRLNTVREAKMSYDTCFHEIKFRKQFESHLKDLILQIDSDNEFEGWNQIKQIQMNEE